MKKQLKEADDVPISRVIRAIPTENRRMSVHYRKQSDTNSLLIGRRAR